MLKMERLLGWLPASLAVLGLLILFYLSAGTSYAEDDFGWLNLLSRFRDGEPLARLLFAPMAQGTIRTLSERLPFLFAAYLGGLEPYPFRALHVGVGVLTLAIWFAWLRSMQVSRALAILVLAIWYLNPALAKAHLWSSALNQTFQALMIGVCLVLSKQQSYWLLPALITSFFVHELCVLIPVYIVASEGVGVVKTRLWQLSVVFAALFVVVSRYFAGGLQNQTYTTSFTFDGMLSNLYEYALLAGVSGPWALAGIIFAGCLMGYTGTRRRLSFHPLAAALLLPLVVYCGLTNIQNGYYLTVPLLGVAIAICLVLRDASGLGFWGEYLALVTAICLLSAECQLTYPRLLDIRARTREFAQVLETVAIEARRLPPQPVVLSGLGRRGFSQGFGDDPLRTIGVKNVYLSPEPPMEILDAFDPIWFRSRFVDEVQLRDWMKAGSARFVHVDRGAATMLSGAAIEGLSHRTAAPDFIIRRPGASFDLNQPGDDGLGAIENGLRWTASRFRVGVRPGVPADATVAISGFVRGEAGRCRLTVDIEGKALPPIDLSAGWQRHVLGTLRSRPSALSGIIEGGCKLALGEVLLIGSNPQK